MHALHAECMMLLGLLLGLLLLLLLGLLGEEESVSALKCVLLVVPRLLVEWLVMRQQSGIIDHQA